MVACGAIFVTSPASAYCAYKDILYYPTTLQEEFVDAPLVVKAKVLSIRDENADDPRLDKEDRDWGTFYRLQVDQVFKGNPPSALTDYTAHNSGGFCLDAGKEYLLFLGPVSKIAFLPRGTMMVNYSCGQSREWKNVPAKDRERLLNLMKGEYLPQ